MSKMVSRRSVVGWVAASILATATVLIGAVPSQAAQQQGGNCDAFTGATRLGSAYSDSSLVVPTCGPVGSTQKVTAADQSSYWNGYQCVEFSERYLYYKFGAAFIGGTNGDQVVDHYAAGKQGSLFTVSTGGSAATAPQVGDVVSFSHVSSFAGGDGGHTGVIIAAPALDGSGNGQVTLAEQNRSSSGSVVLQITGWKFAGSPIGFAYVKWLHAKTATATASPTPSPTPTSAPAHLVVDARLRGCVSAELKSEYGLAVPEPAAADLAKLQRLSCPGPDSGGGLVTTLNGLQYATNATYIEASGTFGNMTFVAKLPKLATLALYGPGSGGGNIQNLNDFKGNKTLTWLWITDEPISDASILGTLPNLQTASLDRDRIYNASSVQAFAHRPTYLYMRDEQVVKPPVKRGTLEDLPKVVGPSGSQLSYSVVAGSGSVPTMDTLDPLKVEWNGVGTGYLQWSDGTTQTCSGCGDPWYYVNLQQRVTS